LRTWLDDGRYIGPVLWRLDTAQISIDAFPKRAFDSPEERNRVAALMEQYNHPDGAGAEVGAGAGEGGAVAQASLSPEATPEESTDSDDQDDEEEPDDESATEDTQSNVEMTPEIDAGFAQIARERILRAPFRYYLVLPLKRAASLWFDTHSQYYPFEGDLLPLKDLDYDIHQHYWLPLFAGITWLYTILGLIGGLMLWRKGTIDSRRWVLMAALIIFLRLGFFSTLENPEPRYVVELFPFLSILGGIAIAQLLPTRHLRVESTTRPST